jgi:hypothetical protein
MPKDRDEELPSTLQRSPAKARRTWREARVNVQDGWAALGGTVEHRF